jgi:hypothetical protein
MVNNEKPGLMGRAFLEMFYSSFRKSGSLL